MPTYDYVCDACKNAFEEFQSMKDEPLKKCPKCGKKKLRRLIGTGAAIIFKGAGFYQTDYRSESYKQAAKADEGAPAAASPTTGKSDKSDSAAKTDTAAPTAKVEKPPAKSSSKKSKSES